MIFLIVLPFVLFLFIEIIKTNKVIKQANSDAFVSYRVTYINNLKRQERKQIYRTSFTVFNLPTVGSVPTFSKGVIPADNVFNFNYKRKTSPYRFVA